MSLRDLLNYMFQDDVSSVPVEEIEQSIEPQNYGITDEILNNLKEFRGTFDVHVTVDEKQVYIVNQYCNLNKIGLAYAIGKTGRHNQQLMTSTLVQNTTGATALLDAVTLAKNLEKQGITVLRIKLEAMAENPAVENFKKTNEYKKNRCYYYEFHFKVSIRSEEDQKLLEKLCDKHKVSYAINFLSKNRFDPLISFRTRGDYKKSLKLRQAFIDDLVKHQLTPLSDGTHYEFTIFDNNYGLDEGLVLDPIEA